MKTTLIEDYTKDRHLYSPLALNFVDLHIAMENADIPFRADKAALVFYTKMGDDDIAIIPQHNRFTIREDKGQVFGWKVECATLQEVREKLK